MFGHDEDVDRPERTPVVERQVAREDDIDPCVRSTFTVRTRDMSAPDSSSEVGVLVTELTTVAPAFVEIAHRIVWATAATVEPSGRPRTRILHPIWEWNGDRLVGWIATGPDTPKARHPDSAPRVSLT